MSIIAFLTLISFSVLNGMKKVQKMHRHLEEEVIPPPAPPMPPTPEEIAGWVFPNKDEAISMCTYILCTDLYEVVRNRKNGKLTKGWVLKKRT